MLWGLVDGHGQQILIYILLVFPFEFVHFSSELADNLLQHPNFLLKPTPIPILLPTPNPNPIPIPNPTPNPKPLPKNPPNIPVPQNPRLSITHKDRLSRKSSYIDNNKLPVHGAIPKADNLVQVLQDR